MDYIIKNYINKSFRVTELKKEVEIINSGALEYINREINWGKAGERILLRDYILSSDLTNKVLEAHSLLNDTVILNNDFNLLINYNKSSTFCFLDPPYHGHPNNNYYGSGDNFDHKSLKRFIENLEGNFILCYGESEYIRELYSEYKVYPYLLSSTMSKEGFSRELIITNKELPVEPVDFTVSTPRGVLREEIFESVTLEEFLLGGFNNVESK